MRTRSRLKLQSDIVARPLSQKWLSLFLAWALAAFFAWPVLAHRTVMAHRESRSFDATVVGYALAAFLCYWFYRAESRRLHPARNRILIVLIFLLTCFANQIHYYFVDQGSVFSYETNLVWQEQLQIDVAKLAPSAAPHSYRFLPNGIVLWMQVCRVRYDVARNLYRLIFGLLLFYALYRFARLYTDYLGAVLALLMIAAVYPMSFELYAGQLTDPLSHLSFVLAFIFLESQDFEFLLTALLIGSLAKETVLAMTGYYILFCRTDKRYVSKSSTLALASLAAYYGVRWLVLHGTLSYGMISNHEPNHLINNLNAPGWKVTIPLLVGGYLTFLVLGWKETPIALKRLAIYLIPLLIVSNYFFGWLGETRNYMPAVFVLAVIAGRYISRRVALPSITCETSSSQSHSASASLL